MRRSPEPVPPAADVPERVGLVEGLQLVPVQNPAQSAVWMMITEHPLGKAVLVGCRYLVGFGPARRGGVRSLGAAPGGARQPAGTTRRGNGTFTASSG